MSALTIAALRHEVERVLAALEERAREADEVRVELAVAVQMRDESHRRARDLAAYCLASDRWARWWKRLARDAWVELDADARCRVAQRFRGMRIDPLPARDIYSISDGDGDAD